MSSMPRKALKTSASKPGVIGVASSRLNALARAITSCGSEMSAGVILSTTSMAVYPSMRSAPTLKIWMTPFSAVAMLKKLALLKIAFCSAPVLSRAASRRTSVTTSTVPAASSEMAGSWYCADMSHPPSNLTPLASGWRPAAAATGIQRRDRTLRPRQLLSPAAGPGGGGRRGARLGREPRVLAKRDGLCVLAQPVAEGVAVENDLLARILQVSLTPELIHVVSDDFARRAHILGA